MEISVLIEKAQAGDASARKILIEENLGLVHHIVKRFAGRGYEAEDLFQTGTIGLMKAIDHFDLSYDVKFSTYAVPLIAGEIRRFLRDDGPVKVSRSLKDANYKLRQEAARIQTQEGRDPTLRELCEKTGIAYEDAVMAVAAAVMAGLGIAALSPRMVPFGAVDAGPQRLAPLGAGHGRRAGADGARGADSAHLGGVRRLRDARRAGHRSARTHQPRGHRGDRCRARPALKRITA